MTTQAESTTTAGAPPSSATAGTGGGGGGSGASTSAPAAAGSSSASVEERLDRIEAALARLVPASHAEAEQRTEERLDRPASVEEQVRAELDRARREEQANADHEDLGKVKQDLAAMRETPPAEPPRVSTKLLGWGTRD